MMDDRQARIASMSRTLHAAPLVLSPRRHDNT